MQFLLVCFEKRIRLFAGCGLLCVTQEGYLYRMIFAKYYNKGSSARTVHTGPSIACSTEAALEWDEEFKWVQAASLCPTANRGRVFRSTKAGGFLFGSCG